MVHDVVLANLKWAVASKTMSVADKDGDMWHVRYMIIKASADSCVNKAYQGYEKDFRCIAGHGAHGTASLAAHEVRDVMTTTTVSTAGTQPTTVWTVRTGLRVIQDSKVVAKDCLRAGRWADLVNQAAPAGTRARPWRMKRLRKVPRLPT